MNPIEKAPTIEQEIEAIPKLLSEVDPIEKEGESINNQEDLKNVVEGPLLSACEELWNKNIETYMTSANKKDVGSSAYIVLAYESLSEENKKVALQFGRPYEYREKQYVKISFPVDKETTIEEIEKNASEAVSKFSHQPMSWAETYTIQELRKIWGSDELTVEDFKQKGFSYVYDEESGLFYRSEEQLKKSKSVEILSKLRQINSTEELPFLSLEQENEIKEIFLRIKQKIEDKKISPRVEHLLLSADVVGVLTNIKPASYIQPKIEKKALGILKVRQGFSEKELAEFEAILQEFGVDFHWFAQDDKTVIEMREDGFVLIQIFKQDNLIDLMKKSRMFTADEIALAEKNPGDFFDYMSAKKIGYASAARIGAVFGYPLSDVSNFVERQRIGDKLKDKGLPYADIDKFFETKDAKMLEILSQEDINFMLKFKERETFISVKSTNGSIAWKSTNADSEEVRHTVGIMKSVFELQKKIL